jgi:hypothetical protein
MNKKRKNVYQNGTAALAQRASGLGRLQLHRGRFIEWSPKAVVASAVTDDGTVVAVAREDGNIELWDTQLWHCFKVSASLFPITLRQSGASRFL